MFQSMLFEKWRHLRDLERNKLFSIISVYVTRLKPFAENWKVKLDDFGLLESISTSITLSRCKQVAGMQVAGMQVYVRNANVLQECVWQECMCRQCKYMAGMEISGLFVRGRDACGRNAGNVSGSDVRGACGRNAYKWKGRLWHKCRCRECMQGGSDADLFLERGLESILKFWNGFQDLGSNPENAEMGISFQPAYHFSSVRGSALKAEIYFSPVRNLTTNVNVLVTVAYTR
jgi:hypothetical protein